MMISLESGENVSSITNLIKEHLSGNTGEFWFRGQPNYEHKLIPALFREQYDEAGMYEEFIRRFPEHSNNHKNVFEWLTLMQHYGLPTRLLDWTTNLLVALFFCCSKEDDMEKDGAIFMFLPNLASNLSESFRDIAFSKDFYFSYLTELLIIAKNKQHFSERFHSVLLEYATKNHDFFRGENVEINGAKLTFAKDIIFGEAKDTFSFTVDGREQSFCSTYYPYKLPYKNPRIRQQHGCFTFHGGKFFDNKEFIPMSKMEEKENMLIKIKITPNKKKAILKELKLLGISEAILFPEMEYQAKHIKEIYKYD